MLVYPKNNNKMSDPQCNCDAQRKIPATITGYDVCPFMEFSTE